MSDDDGFLDLFEKPEPEPEATKVLSITQLTRKIRNLLELKIGKVTIEGEISNLRKQNSGHVYFTLKDQGAQVSCVLFRSDAARVRIDLKDGIEANSKARYPSTNHAASTRSSAAVFRQSARVRCR